MKVLFCSWLEFLTSSKPICIMYAYNKGTNKALARTACLYDVNPGNMRNSEELAARERGCCAERPLQNGR